MAKQEGKLLTGPFTLKINKHEQGMAVSIAPHLDKQDLSELLLGVIDSIMVETHMPIMILIPRDKSQQVKIASASGVKPDVLAEFLRKLADGIEEKQSP